MTERREDPFEHEPAPGFPAFEHNQWTVEGEIERIGAFSRGAAGTRGWRRPIAILMLVLLVGPIAIGLVGTLWSIAAG